MMMRQIESYLIDTLLIAALAGIILISTHPAFGAVDGSQNLNDVISQCHDTHMTVGDLAFFLATHNYDATPKDGYVQITIGGTIYEAVPNSATGLADISIMN
jgi:hypothetical protein